MVCLLIQFDLVAAFSVVGSEMKLISSYYAVRLLKQSRQIAASGSHTRPPDAAVLPTMRFALSFWSEI